MAGANDELMEVAERAATQAPLNDVGALSWLLDSMHKAGAHSQVMKLATRAVTRAPLKEGSLSVIRPLLDRSRSDT